MPIWMRKDDPREMFGGALESLGSVEWAVLQDLRPWPFEPPEAGPERLRQTLQAHPFDLRHDLDDAFDALDRILRAGYRTNDAEELLQSALAVREAIDAADAESLIERVRHLQNIRERLKGSASLD